MLEPSQSSKPASNYPLRVHTCRPTEREWSALSSVRPRTDQITSLAYSSSRVAAGDLLGTRSVPVVRDPESFPTFRALRAYIASEDCIEVGKKTQKTVL